MTTATPQADSIVIEHYRAGSLRHTFTVSHDYERPPVDAYLLAVSAGIDDEFRSTRTVDGSRLDWALEWKDDRVIVDCTPYKLNEAKERVPTLHYVMCVPLWPVSMPSIPGAFHISGIGMGWRAYTVERTTHGKTLEDFKGVSLSTGQQMRVESGVIAGVDWSTMTALVRVDDSAGRWFAVTLDYASKKAR